MILFPETGAVSNSGANTDYTYKKTDENGEQASTQSDGMSLSVFTNTIVGAAARKNVEVNGSNGKIASVFNELDQDHNTYLSTSEFNAGTQATADLVQTLINESLSKSYGNVNVTDTDVTTQSSSDIVQAGEITTSNGTVISKAALNSVSQTLKEGGAEALANDIVNDIGKMISDGCDVSISGGIVTITDPDGSTEEINLNEIIANGVIKNHVDSIANGWEQKGFSEVVSTETQKVDGKERVVVTLQNPDTGDTVKIFGDTGAEIKADVNTGTDS